MCIITKNVIKVVLFWTANLGYQAVQARGLSLADWVPAREVRLNNFEELAISPSLLSLDRAVRGKRIVFLGEPDHYITEKLEYQLALIKRFDHLGFHVIGVEMGRSDARRINQYLINGDESILNTVALFGNLSEVRTDRDLPKGLLAGGASEAIRKQSNKFWIQGNRDFWKKIRELNVNRPIDITPVQVVGFDVDVVVGGAYRDFSNLIGNSAHSLLSTLSTLLQKVEAETRLAEIQRLKRAQAYLLAHYEKTVALLGVAKVLDFKNSLQQLIDSLQFIDVAFENPNGDQWLNAVTEREKTMMWQMEEYLGQFDKMILIGHNDHLAEKSMKLNRLSVTTNQFTASWNKIGTYLHEHYANDVFGIWMLYGSGTRSSGPECPELSCQVQPIAQSINFRLAQIIQSGISILRLDQGPLPLELTKAVDYQFNGPGINSAILPEQAQALIFIPHVTATHSF